MGSLDSLHNKVYARRNLLQREISLLRADIYDTEEPLQVENLYNYLIRLVDIMQLTVSDGVPNIDGPLENISLRKEKSDV